MLTRRVIACLDVSAGRVVKGVRFENLRDVGDPIERAATYARDGADELCFLDVSASVEGRGPLVDLVERVAERLRIPFTVGGGVSTIGHARDLLRAGADKVALSTAAVRRPELITELSDEFGAQCVVLSIDTRRAGPGWVVTMRGGRDATELSTVEWARAGQRLGAGEILLNAIDTDGARDGFSIDITREVADAVSVPVIASGGAGSAAHFASVFAETGASAALAASIFHESIVTPNGIKTALAEEGIPVRL